MLATLARTNAIVRQILADHQPEPIPAEIEAAVQEEFGIIIPE